MLPYSDYVLRISQILTVYRNEIIRENNLKIIKIRDNKY
jgi:hypothetical protein